MGTGAFPRQALCAKTGSLRGDSDRVVYKGGGGGGGGGSNANSRGSDECEQLPELLGEHQIKLISSQNKIVL